MGNTLARVLAALLLAASAASWGWRAGLAQAARVPDYSTYPPELLANVIEGKLEQISELQDDVARLRQLQAGMVSVARPPPA